MLRLGGRSLGGASAAASRLVGRGHPQRRLVATHVPDSPGAGVFARIVIVSACEGRAAPRLGRDGHDLGRLWSARMDGQQRGFSTATSAAARSMRGATATAMRSPPGDGPADSRRGLATSSGGGAAEALRSRTMTALETTREYLLTRTGGLIAGGLVTLFIARVAYKTMHAFIHLDFYTVAEVGFTAGFVSAASAALGLYWTRQALAISPEEVLRESFRLVKASPGVLEMMGATGPLTRLRTGLYRAYHYESGGFGLSPSRGAGIGFAMPSLKLTYQVYGGDKQAVVVVGARRAGWGRLVVELVTVDLLQPNTPEPAKTIIVVGDASLLRVRDELRRGVSLNRRYVDSLSEPEAHVPSRLSKGPMSSP